MTTHYQRNREAILAKQKAKYLADKDFFLSQNKEWRQNNPEKFHLYRRKWLQNNPLYITLSNCRARSKREGYPCDIDLAYLNSLEYPKYCPILGIKIDQTKQEFKLSLDKVVPEKGYTKGNVNFISMKANRMKAEATIEQLEKLLAYMKR